MNWKAVSSGQAVDDAALFTQTLRGNSLKPLAPVNVTGQRNVANDLFIGWIRRTRVGGGMRPNTGVPLAEQSEMYDVEVLTGSTVLRTMRALPGLAEPALLIGGTPAQISGNSVLAPGGSDTNFAYSIQNIREASDWAEATMTAPVDGDSSIFGFAPPAIAATNNVSGNLRDYQVNFRFSGGATSLALLENGVSTYTTPSLSGTPTSVRVRVEFTGAAVKFYMNYSGPGSAPFYVSQSAPRLPYALSLVAHFGSAINDIFVGLQSPHVSYYATQQTADGLTPGNPVKVRIYQVSAVVGRGPYVEATI